MKQIEACELSNTSSFAGTEDKAHKEGPKLRPVRCSRLVKARLSGDQCSKAIKLPQIRRNVRKNEPKVVMDQITNFSYDTPSAQFKSFDAKPQSFLDKLN